MKKELWLIFSIVFLGLLGFGIVIPTLPFVAENFGASPTQIGLLLASYSLFQFIGSPILGRLSDRYGRKPILAISLLGSAAGFFLIAFAKDLRLMFASRIIDGLTGGNISVAQAYIADITVSKERTKAMGLIGAAFGLGFVFGPLIGGLLSPLGWVIPYLVAGGLAVIDAVLIMLILPESERRVVRERTMGHFWDQKTLAKVFTPKSVLYLTVFFFLVTLAFSLMQGIFTLYSEKIFGWGEQQNGMFFALIGGVMIITQGLIIRRLTKVASDKKLIKYSLPLIGVALLLFAGVKNPKAFYLGAVLLALCMGVFNTALQAEISKESDQEEQGIVLGTVQGFGSLARTVGPVVGALVFSHVSISAPFWLSGVLIMGLALMNVSRG